MKPILNTIPKRPMFMCERRSNGMCARICGNGVGEPHSHDNDKETLFFCHHYSQEVRCKEVE